MIGNKMKAKRDKAGTTGWHRSIGIKLFAAFLASIVLACGAAGGIAYQISADALKQKIGSNMNQVVQDAASNSDRWFKVMDGTYNQLAIYADKNKFTSKDRRLLEPQTEPEATEYKKLIAQLKTLDEEIAANTAKAGKAADSAERIKLNEAIARGSQSRNGLVSKFNELNQPKSELDAALNAYISAYAMTNADMIYSIGMIRFNGENQTFSTTGKARGDNLYETDWAAEVLKGKGKNVYLPSRVGSLVTADEETRVFAIAKSFWSPEDQKWADILIVEYKLGFFENLLKPINFGGIGDIHLVDHAGHTLYSNRPGVKFGQPDAVAAGAQGGKETYLTFSQPLQNTDWTLSGAIPEALLLEDARTIRDSLIYLVLGGAAAALLLGLWGYRTIGRPLMVAGGKMRQAENGDLNVRLNMNRRKDEIGAVSGSFDSMMERIAGIVVQTGRSADRLIQATARINEQVQRSREASGEIAVAMNEVSTGADSLSRDAEKSSVLTADMTSRLEDVLAVNRKMKEIAVEVEESGKNGAAAIGELSHHNEQAEGVVSSLSDRMSRLQAGTESISVVLDMVANISKQINILSLNASIVAASAGESGKGFMVVAGEIRSLANQSKESIASVEAVIAAIQSDMDETSRLVADSLPIFRRQSDISRSSQNIFRHVETSMSRFMDSFQHVWNSLQFSMEAQAELAGTMMQVSAVSEQSTATTENVASLIRDQHESGGELVRTGEELEQLAEELRQSLKVFQAG
ncbi:methyl-accepting chemotaxis protein [Paenibacillus hodogayensis]|uniref:Methyl-accepting chemotaxis protein n=1 Tax=Paenibacillus hodogayensis TaxID=279208 RepID=A0ABV5VU47_9BACL